MPRPRPGYVRPTEVECIVCGGSIPVEAKGRVPESHATCGRLSQDVQRVLTALDDAVEGRTLEELRRIRTGLWQPRIVGEANRVWNIVDNPAKRGR